MANKPVVIVNGETFRRICIGIPTISMTLAILCGYLFQFDAVTKTHCKVPNFIPSISSIIGEGLSKYVWRCGVSFYIAQRFLDAYCLYVFNAGLIPKATQHSSCASFDVVNRWSSYALVWENFWLIILTYVSSTEHFPVHQAGFIGFVVFASIHMFTSLALAHWNERKPAYEYAATLFGAKVRCVAFNMMAIIGVGYFYVRHNSYCEPYVYSLFALCEWSVVYSNIYYNWLVSWDFAGYHLMLAPGVPSSFQPLSVLNHSSSYSNSGSGRREAGDYDLDRTDEFDTPAKLL